MGVEGSLTETRGLPSIAKIRNHIPQEEDCRPQVSYSDGEVFCGSQHLQHDWIESGTQKTSSW